MREFKKSVERENLNTNSEIYKQLAGFMATVKGLESDDTPTDVNKFFNDHLR